MEIKTQKKDGVNIVELSGSLDSSTSPQAQEQLLPLVVAKCLLVLDLSKCTYISSAGLRVLLMLAKQLTAKEARLALAGACPEIKDVMEMTGFINFFLIHDSVPEAIEAVRKECA